MTSKERILNQVLGKPVDRIPMLGGWNLGVDNICRLAGRSRVEYAADPFGTVLQANRNLHGTGPAGFPAYLKTAYWPHARYSIAPLLEAGIRLVYHCDGNVMPIIPDIVDIGFSGFQGFQYEFDIDPYKLRKFVKDRPPLFFAGLSVTKTLPAGTVADVRREVEYGMDFSRGGQGLFLFTSNVTGIDVPPENLQAAYAHQASLAPGAMTATGWREWPWRAVERARA